MTQFDEFSSPRGTTSLEGETEEERRGAYEVPQGRSAQTSAAAQPELIELGSGAPVHAASGSARGEPRGAVMAEARSSRTLLASGDLLSDSEGLRRQWESVQVGFVDDPRRAVGEADSLVSSVIDELVAGFRQQHYSMEAQWSEGKEVSTDELREAFQHYRDFFERLLKV